MECSEVRGKGGNITAEGLSRGDHFTCHVSVALLTYLLTYSMEQSPS